ncbi:MAG: energy-coupled thiamine transporter ThiT [Firmicutes bacterium]|nr:energy-coupled thiamine transporter ThiT [Bacillota bacterium]
MEETLKTEEIVGVEEEIIQLPPTDNNDDDDDYIVPVKNRGFRNKHLRAITYGAVCLALSFALSFVGFRMPMGGMISLAAIAPIVIFVYLFGFKYGVIIVVANTFLRTITGSTILGFGQVVLDYIIPMMALIVVALIPRLMNPNKESGKFFESGLYAGIAIFAVIRWISQTISGIVYFDAPLGFSLLYNSFGLIDAAIAAIALAALFRSSAFVKELRKIQALQHDMVFNENEVKTVINKKVVVILVAMWSMFLVTFLVSSAAFRRDIEPLNAAVETHQARMDELTEIVPNWNLRRNRGSANETTRLENVFEKRIAWLSDTVTRNADIDLEIEVINEEINDLNYRIAQMVSDTARQRLTSERDVLIEERDALIENKDERLEGYQSQIATMNIMNETRNSLVVMQYGLYEDSEEFAILQGEINNWWRWYLRQFDPYRFNDRTLRPARSHRNQTIWMYIGLNLFLALVALGVTVALEKRSIVQAEKPEKEEK